MIWYRYPFWVFDMDGTLTLSMHDFAAIKKELGLPLNIGILEALERMPQADAAPIHRRLEAIEWELAGQAKAAEGASDLLTALERAGAKVGILTRNTRKNAFKTLQAAGLGHFFEQDYILGRNEAKPKPDPEGLLYLMELWEGQPEQSVMVGDFQFDLEAAKNAGMHAVYVDPSGEFPHEQFADVSVKRLSDLLPFKVRTN